MLSAADLLAPHDADLDTIRRLAGVPAAHWQVLYREMLHAYAGFVQRLPASEAHHHAGPGGLLAHGIEVVREALKLRRGHLLPPGAPVEVVAREQDLWTYAAASAALLHDLGKPACDQCVALFDGAGVSMGDWAPWTGAMPGAAAWYRVTFPRERRYGRHARVAMLLAHHVVPPAGLRWLGSTPAVMDAWTAVLSGDHEVAGPLGEIVREADRQSVAANLTSTPVRMPTARARPLHERLLTALRLLLDWRELPLNRRGAAGWVSDGDLWLVSKRALDTVREHLEQEGQGGIPTRNERLMDPVQQHGLVVANGERAIWRAEVVLADWRQPLTLLRFPAGVVWPDPDARPAPFEGTVTPVTGEQDAGAGCVPGDGTTAPASARPPSGDDPVQGPGREVTAHSRAKEAAADPTDPPGDAGERFAAWLREGLASGRFVINQSDAHVHTAAEGLLLVSPAIFKDFDPESWGHVQKRFQRLGVHRKCAKETNVFTYLASGAHRQGRVKVYLVPDPARAFPGVSLPPPNPHLSLLE